jgi:hypothetical protein
VNPRTEKELDMTRQIDGQLSDVELDGVGGGNIGLAFLEAFTSFVGGANGMSIGFAAFDRMGEKTDALTPKGCPK